VGENFLDVLMAWFRENKRDLPWRRDRSVYSVLVSEMMLQQTQVSRVVEYYTRFLDRFPTMEALARASLDEVYHAWSGLGYYRRVRSLYEACRALLEKGILSGEQFSQLPGVGEYTASALRAFALNEVVGVVDANVRRVLSRFRGIVSTEKKRIQMVMDVLVRYGVRRNYESREVNEAFMELGALVCGRERKCFVCPLKRWCCSYLGGRDYVVVEKTVYHEMEEHSVAYLSPRGRLLLLPGRRWWKGLWDLPLEAEVRLGGEVLGSFFIRYSVTNHRVLREVEVRRVGEEVEVSEGRWVDVRACDCALGSPAKRCLEYVEGFVTTNQSGL